MNITQEQIQEVVTEKFLRYARIWTTSDPGAADKRTPSTDGQWDLLNLLKQELTDLGVPEVDLNEKGYLIARLPSNLDKAAPCIGFMAHVDTSEDAPGKDVDPQIYENWNGEAISLRNGVVLNEETAPHMAEFKGDTIITSDGTTLLGSDDKAGVAEIMTAMEILMKNPEIPHGQLEVIFTPDEETGGGMDNFPLTSLKSEYCFTLDGGLEGELEMECYNAWRCDLDIQGSVIHPGYARGKLVNAVTMAAEFISMLPRNESPEATDERFGNYWPHSVEGSLDKAKVSVMIRDFDAEEAKRRVAAVRSFAAAVEAAFPGGKIEVTEKELYKNMKEALDKHPVLEPSMMKAYEASDVKPILKPIRGGTDGARLTAMGIPTPNIFAGGMNFHSVREWVPVSSMGKAVRVVLGLVNSWAE